MDREWLPDFLASLALSPNVSQACREAGISRQAAYKLRESDPEFAKAWDDALEQSTDELVGEMYRRAVSGVEKPVFFKDQKIATVREFSDTLAIFLAKAHRRRVYGDKIQAEVTGVDVASLTDDELSALIESLAGGRAGAQA